MCGLTYTCMYGCVQKCITQKAAAHKLAMHNGTMYFGDAFSLPFLCGAFLGAAVHTYTYVVCTYMSVCVRVCVCV